jgi:hypothetical protein
MTSGELLDHLVGAVEYRPRNGNTNRLGGLEVDDQLVLGGRLYRQVGRLLSFENAIDVFSRAFVHVDGVGPVGCEAPTRRVVSEPVDVRQAIPQCQGNDEVTMSQRRLAPRDDQTAILLTRKRGDGGLDLAGVSRIDWRQLRPK